MRLCLDAYHALSRNIHADTSPPARLSRVARLLTKVRRAFIASSTVTHEKDAWPSTPGPGCPGHNIGLSQPLLPSASRSFRVYACFTSQSSQSQYLHVHQSSLSVPTLPPELDSHTQPANLCPAHTAQRCTDPHRIGDVIE